MSEATCQSCGARLAPTARYCPTCGTEQTAAAAGAVSERRVASVLFADLVGSSGLAESRDIEDTRELLADYYDVCRSVIDRYGGVVEKFIGDAVMAVWGVPAAREDDAERAVRAGLDIVAAVAALAERLGIAALSVRVGIVTDEVAATLGAVGQAMVAGDPVNTAARVQSIAGAGEVLVDAATRQLTLDAVSYSDRGEHELRGKSQAVRLHVADEVVGSMRERRRIDGLHAPMVGRDGELATLRNTLDAVIEQRRPKLVVVSGDAGVGKSRLADEFAAVVDSSPARVAWHHGRCLAYGDGVAMWALAEAVRSRLGLVERDTVTADDVGSALVEHVVDVDQRERLRPRLAVLLGDRTAGDFPGEDLFAAWTDFFELLAVGRDAVVLVVEDAENADRGLLAFLDHLVTTATAPLFVLVLARPELLAAHGDLGGDAARTVTLERLSDGDMAEMMSRLVANLPEQARDHLVTRAGGVPLFAVETVRALVDRDLVGAHDGAYSVHSGVQLDLSGVDAPTSLRSLIAARLDTLAVSERRFVSDAAVFGRAFTAADIAVLSPADDAADQRAVLDALVGKEILQLEGDPFAADRGHFRFVHALVREVAYATLSRRDRRSKHLAVAEHLAGSDRAGELAAVAARHLFDAIDASRAGDGDVAALTTQAVALMAAAADRAGSLGSFAEALDLYRSAIAHSDDPAFRAELSARAADAATTAADYQSAEALSGDAIAFFDATGDVERAAVVAATHGRAVFRQGHRDAALAAMRPRYEALRDVEGTEAARLALGHMLVGVLTFTTDTPDPELAQLVHEQLRWAEQVHDDRALLRAMHGLARFEMVDGSVRVAEVVMREVAELAEQVGDWRTRGMVLGELALNDFDRDPHRCLAQLTASLDVARRHGLQDLADNALHHLSQLLWITGRWSQLGEVLAEFADGGQRHDPTRVIFLRIVDLWRVAAGHDAVLDQPPVADGHQVESAWLVHLSMLRSYVHGATAAAAADAEYVFAPEMRAGMYRQETPLLLHWSGEVLLAAGDVDGARRLLAIADEHPSDTIRPAMSAHRQFLRAALAVATDDGDVEAELAANVDGFVRYDSPPFRAQAHELFGRWLVGRGRGDEATEHFDAARRVYTELGATIWLQRVEELAAADAVGAD